MKLSGTVEFVDSAEGHVFVKAPLPVGGDHGAVYEWLADWDQELGAPIESLVMTREKYTALGLQPGPEFLWVGMRTNAKPRPGQSVNIEIEE